MLLTSWRRPPSPWKPNPELKAGTHDFSRDTPGHVHLRTFIPDHFQVMAASHQRDLHRVRQTGFGAGDPDLQPHVRLNISISVFAMI